MQPKEDAWQAINVTSSGRSDSLGSDKLAGGLHMHTLEQAGQAHIQMMSMYDGT